MEQTCLYFTGKQCLALCLQLVKTLECQLPAETCTLSDVHMFGMGKEQIDGWGSGHRPGRDVSALCDVTTAHNAVRVQTDFF